MSDAIYELEFRQDVQQGLDELDRGEGIPIEEVEAKISDAKLSIVGRPFHDFLLQTMRWLIEFGFSTRAR